MAEFPIVGAEHGRIHARLDLGRHNRKVGLFRAGRVAIDPVCSRRTVVAAEPRAIIPPRPLATVIARTLVARTVISGTVISGTVITGAVVTRAVVARAVVARTVVARTLVTCAITRRAVTTGLIVWRRPLRRSKIVPSPLEPRLPFPLGFANLADVAIPIHVAAVPGATLVLKVDIKTGHELIAPDDLGKGPVWLHRPHHAEIVLGVLQVVLGQYAVARSLGVARQLLILLIDRLRRAAHLDPFGTIGIKRPVRIMLGLSPAASAATSAIAVAVTLPLHALEISHVLDLYGARHGSDSSDFVPA